jgi:hypothetical protein
MTWKIDWSAVAERDLLALPWRLAARIDAAVIAFATAAHMKEPWSAWQRAIRTECDCDCAV